MSDKRQIEQSSFETWWDEKGFNSVILRVAAWEAWMARAELQQQEFLATSNSTKDPDEWVILDSVNYANHVPRVGVDEFSAGNGRWQIQKEHHCNGTVAYWKAKEDIIHRCRRRDLPKSEQKTLVELCSDKTPTADISILGGPHDVCVMQSSGHPEPQPKYGQWFRNKTDHSDYMQFLAMSGGDVSVPLVLDENGYQHVLASFFDDYEPCNGPPQKTRVRLFASFGALHIRMPGEITEGIGKEVKHDSEGFYIEE